MKTYDLKLIQVLWVEDDQDAVERGQMDAYSFGLQLEAFPCWDDAKKVLDEEYDRWSAIILDAKCKYHADSSDNAVRFLGEALKDISILGEKKGRIIPWYVFTGGDEGEVSDSINDDRMKWDGDWTESKKKKYYSKNTDDEDLYRRIRYHAQKSPRLQTFEKYHDVINHLISLDNYAGVYILDILEAMHFPSKHPEFKPILYYNPLRQILEYLFRAANKYCIVPDECFDDKGDPNLSQCCHYLSGNDATYARVRYGSKEKKDRVVPLHIELMMRMILDVGNINSHSTKLSEIELKELEQYLNKNVFNSCYLIYSLALNVCEITLWLKNYIDSHQDIEKNKNMCLPLNGNEIDKQTSDEDEKETKRLLGAINKEKNKVYSYDLSKNIIIDKKNGFKKNCSPKEYDYVDNEKVYFELKEQINPKTNLPFSFAVNINPARKENTEDITHE